MIFEYAIDPEVFASWARREGEICYVKDKIGIGTQRLIAAFPTKKSWRKQLGEAYTKLYGKDASRYEAQLKPHLLEKKIISRDRGEYEDNLSWLEKTKIGHDRLPFRAILTTSKINTNKHVLKADEPDGEWKSDAMWDIEPMNKVPRQSKKLAEAIAPLLQNSSEIFFVDPYFTPEWESYTEPLEKYLQQSIKNRVNSGDLRVEIIASADRKKKNEVITPEVFQRDCEKYLPCRIPSCMSLTVKHMKKRKDGIKLHPRYVLTDIGGVEFSEGLSIQKNEKTRISILNYNEYWDCYDDYCDDGKIVFEIVNDFTIKGEK